MNYGLAGGRTNNGQGFTRYQIAGDPSPYYPIFAAGTGMKASPPAYMMPNSGGAFRYGSTIVHGIKNMISDGQVCRPIMANLQDINGFNVQQLLGLSSTLTQSITAGQPAHTRIIMLQNALNQVQAIVNHNGEMIYRDTIQASNQMGAVSEGFTGYAGTATVNLNSPTVTIVGGPTFSSVVLSTSYAYTPDFIHPAVGDILEVVTAGGTSSFYRVAAINLTGGTLTSVTTYPNYGGPNATGLTYKFWRTGYGSSSNHVILYNSEDIYLYYAGNVIRNSLGGAGTLQCIHVNAKSPFTFQHYMAPATGGIGGRPACTDIIYFKGFILYGAGNAIGWTVGDFPTDFTTGFGATDLPAENVNAFQTNGVFLYFHRVGDQVFAVFTSGVAVVSTTGSVPEFDFIMMPDTAGGIMNTTPDPETLSHTFMSMRGAATGDSIAVHRSPSGLRAVASNTPQRISTALEPVVLGAYGEIQYSDSLGYFMMGFPNFDQAYAFFPETNEWCSFDMSEVPAFGAGLSTNVIPGNLLNRGPRVLDLAFWKTTARIILVENSSGAEFEEDLYIAANSVTSWEWSTPIVALGDLYEGFQLGSFRPLIRPASGDSPPGITFNMTVYGGYSPTQMSVIYGPIPIDYSLGIPSAIEMPNIAKSDVPYVAFNMKGQRWCELVGIALYPVGTASRR